MSDSKLLAGQCSLKLDDVTFVFRKPEQDEFEDYQEAVRSTKRHGPCYRELAQKCLVSPDLATLQAAFLKYPGAATRVADTLSDLAGCDVSLTVGKG